jgi:hypothetical protein
MRFMVLVKGDERSEAGVLPSQELITEMGAFNEEMAKAGVMIGGDGLQPTSKGALVRFSRGGKTTTIPGPFGEPGQVVAGYWLLEADSLEEVIDWIKRMPNPEDQEGDIEIRQVYEMDDFGDRITPEFKEQQQRILAQGTQE